MPDFIIKPTLRGHSVTLVPATVEHVPDLMPMLTDPEISRLTGSRGDIDPDVIKNWYATRAEQSDRLDLAVIDNSTGSCVGEAVLNELDSDNQSCNFRIALVPVALGRGFGTEATRLIVGYGFEKLGLHRISLEVYAFNPRAKRAYEKAGFVEEGRRRHALQWDGEWVDAIMMSMLVTEWQNQRDE
ncbi:MAG TPA: GNAT family protein [Jiangellaceae bacterium]